MEAGARTPEELEALLEDAFVLRDPRALAQLFRPGAMLVVGGGLPDARGHQQITRLAARLWRLDYPTVGMPAMAAGVSRRRSGTTMSAARTSSGGGG